MVGGFPCQAFSIAGKRKGFADQRGNLFFEIIRIIKQTKPAYLLLENVKGLLHHDEGKTFKTIIQSLAELGYVLQWQVLNSKDFGVPQHRERIYIVGYLGEESRSQIFPLKTSDKQHRLSQMKEAIQPTIRIKEATKTGYAVASVGDSIDTSFPTSTMRRGRIGRQCSHTLTTKKCHATLTHNKKLRYITPLECERLQGFPDNWTQTGLSEKGITEISDTQRYKCLGNAVSVPVVKEIITHLLK